MNILSPESRVKSTSPPWHSLFDSTIQQISSSSMRYGWSRSVRNISIDFLTCGKVYISNHICSWLIKLNVSTNEQTSNTVDPTGLGFLALSVVLNSLKSLNRLLVEEFAGCSAWRIQKHSRILMLPSVGVHGNSENICCFTSPFFFFFW